MESFDYFLLIAEELNFSRAAQRAYVSQQCLSTYVRKLEEEYGVLLFNRKPTLSLTPAGEVLLQQARQINMIKKNIRAEIAALKEEDAGEINIGISYGRAMRMMTYVLPRFRKLYPNVTVNVRFGITNGLEKDLLDGRIDMYVGVGDNSERKKIFKRTILLKESVDIAITERMLERYFPDEYPNCKERFMAGVDLREFESIPFIINSNTNIIMKKVTDLLKDKRINIKPAITVEANEIQLALCDLGVCFSFQTLRNYVDIVNAIRPAEDPIRIFPIQELQNCCNIELISLQNTYMLPQVSSFERLVRQCYNSSVDNRIADYLQIAPK